MLHWLEKKVGWCAIPNLPLVLVGGQILVFLLGISQPHIYTQLLMIPALVLQGQVWRVFTFIFLAPVLDPTSLLYEVSIILFIINVYMLWLFGSALEKEWGAFRFNLYVFTGFVATIAASFLVPIQPASTAFLYWSLFLAFAFLYPDFEILLFFILPVKVKWLALAGWLGYAYLFVTGDWMARILILAAVTNFLLFFWHDLFQMLRLGSRRMARQAKASSHRDDPFHKCLVCGKTEVSDPQMEFRYCPHCTDAPCYCADHIHNHEHR